MNLPIADFVKRVTVIAHDPQGNVWVGTERHGIYVYDGINWEPFDLERWGVADGEIHAIVFDNAGHVWVASRQHAWSKDGSLVRYDGISGTHYADLPAINSITIDSQDNLWLATSQGATVLEANGDRRTIAALAGQNVTSIAIANGQYVWLGTGEAFSDGGNGAYVLDLETNAMTNYRVEDSGLSDNRVAAIVADPLNDHIWIATDSGLSISSSIPIANSTKATFQIQQQLTKILVIFAFATVVAEGWYWSGKSGYDPLKILVRTALVMFTIGPAVILGHDGMPLSGGRWLSCLHDRDDGPGRRACLRFLPGSSSDSARHIDAYHCSHPDCPRATETQGDSHISVKDVEK